MRLPAPRNLHTSSQCVRSVDHNPRCRKPLKSSQYFVFQRVVSTNDQQMRLADFNSPENLNSAPSQSWTLQSRLLAPQNFLCHSISLQARGLQRAYISTRCTMLVLNLRPADSLNARRHSG